MERKEVPVEEVALLVACPVCEAATIEESEPCWDEHGSGNVPIHPERIAYALKLIEDAKAV